MYNQPLISIVTPSLNQARFLEETILSVIEQDYENFEYIIIDGGSNDRSLEIIHKYAKHLTYWESGIDTGQADAINRGFQNASGDIFAWINSDDKYEPGAFSTIIETFNNNMNIDLVFGEGWYIDQNGKRIKPCKFVRHPFPKVYMANKDPILQQSAFWRRNLWDLVGQLDVRYNWVFDWDWFIRAFDIGVFYYIPYFLSNYRIHSMAKTRSDNIIRRVEQRNITLKYGSWWHPNVIVQQFRIWKNNSPNITKPLFRILCKIVENILYGRFSN